MNKISNEFSFYRSDFSTNTRHFSKRHAQKSKFEFSGLAVTTNQVKNQITP